MRTLVRASALVVSSLLLCACPGEEAARVPVPLLVDGGAARETTTAEGWSVSLDEARVSLSDVRLRRGGEEHASFLSPLSRLLIPTARAHPGHSVGGEVIGEALGSFVLDFVADDGETFAEASAFVTDASALDFTFVPFEDAEARGAPAMTAALAGTATRGDEVVRFEAFITQDEGRKVEGVPLNLDVVADGTVGVSLGLLLTSDAGQSVFDGVDFAALPYPRADEVARVEPGTQGHNLVRNALQSHEHYRATEVHIEEAP